MEILREHDLQTFLIDTGPSFPVDYERCEQIDALTFIPPDSVVLELGARTGVVSCIINKILNDPARQVSVEPDKQAIHMLETNKKNTRCKFHIFPGAVSRKSKGIIRNSVASIICEDAGEKVETITLEDLQKTFNLVFDVLVADIEGSFQSFLEENDMTQFKLILLEEDCVDRCDYKLCYDMLKEQGFIIIHRYFDVLNRVVFANTRMLPYDVINFSSPFPLGLFGRLGYLTEKLYVTSPQDISLHAPSRIIIKPKSPLLVKGTLYLTAEFPPSSVKYYINGKEVEEEKLEADKLYELRTETSSGSWAHTGWKVLRKN
jgi:FkbM family methyltransferase